MRRVWGIVLCLPIAIAIPSVISSCHHGGDTRNASAAWRDNLLAAAFILGLPMAFIGLSKIFGSPRVPPPPPPPPSDGQG